MKQERVILSFIMVLIGLVVAGLIFYFYQSTKVIKPSTIASDQQTTPTPTPKASVYLVLNQPIDESVVTNKTLQISGKTIPNATVVVITNSDQEVLNPTTQGDFTTTAILDDGQNIIHVQAITPDGEIFSLERTVTYSTEDF